MKPSIVFPVVLMLSMAVVVAGNLKIASFNIKWLSVHKLSNNMTLSIIKKIIQRYDIISIIEVREDHAIYKLVQSLNMDTAHDPYGAVLSKKLGRTSYKEAYAVLYSHLDGQDRPLCPKKMKGSCNCDVTCEACVYQRINHVFIQEVHQFQDWYDVFARDPYAVVFHSLSSHPPDFVYIVLHTQPTDTPSELEHMVSAYENITSDLGIVNAIIAGDLNADCRYLSQKGFANNLLHTDTRFTWLIDSDVDSTVSDNSDCAYDRFIVVGDQLKKHVVANSARVYNFEQDMHLTFNQSIAVSDHFPIEMELQ